MINNTFCIVLWNIFHFENWNYEALLELEWWSLNHLGLPALVYYKLSSWVKTLPLYFALFGNFRLHSENCVEKISSFFQKCWICCLQNFMVHLMGLGVARAFGKCPTFYLIGLFKSDKNVWKKLFRKGRAIGWKTKKANLYQGTVPEFLISQSLIKFPEVLTQHLFILKIIKQVVSYSLANQAFLDSVLQLDFRSKYFLTNFVSILVAGCSSSQKIHLSREKVKMMWKSTATFLTWNPLWIC